MTSGRILLVGPPDEAPEFTTVLSEHAWVCTQSDTPAGVLRLVRHESPPDLVVLIPDESFDSYVELCREVKFDARTALIFVIFVLPPELAAKRAEIYEAGADDCIQLPAVPREIALRLSNAFRIKRTTDLLEDSTAVLESLANAIEGRDAFTHGHVERVSMYCVEIGKRAGVDAEGLAALKVGGIVHDIGKVLIPDAILNKPGKLDSIEMELMKRHPVIGYDILHPLRIFRDVLPIVRWHHERPNGKGYPDGLKGDQLPLLPRIVAIADVFDAISTPRPYRPALPPSKCTEILCKSAEVEDLDPSLVTILFDILDQSIPYSADTPASLTIA